MPESLPLPLNQMIARGFVRGRTMLDCEALLGCEVFYAEKHACGLAIVEAVTVEPTHVELVLRFRPAGRGESRGWLDHGAHRIGYPLNAIRTGACSIHLNSGYGVHSDIVHDPVAIEQVLQATSEATSPAHFSAVLSRFERQELISRFNGTPEIPGISDPDNAKHPPGEAATTFVPRWCRASADRGVFVLQLRDATEQGTHCAAWVTRWPLALLMAVCRLCLTRTPDLPRDLLQLERTHYRAHPEAAPVLAESSSELFAKKPELAQIFHQRFCNLSWNANLTDDDFFRLLSAITTRCGIRFEPGTVPPRDAESSFNLHRSLRLGTDSHTVILNG